MSRNIQSVQQPSPPRSARPTSNQTVCLEQVARCFTTNLGDFYALRGVTLSFEPASMVAIVGQSGSGKSTLLNLIAGIDRPTGGSIRVAGQEIGALGENALAQFRGRNVGVVFQSFQLLPTLTALENIQLAMTFVAVVPMAERRNRALALLAKVGVLSQANKLPSALSGGQQQRVAIARALANDPAILVADEPTGNLDKATAVQVLEVLQGLAQAGKTVLVATHERSQLQRFNRIVELEDGQVLLGNDVAPVSAGER